MMHSCELTPCIHVLNQNVGFRFGTFRREVAASLRLWSENMVGACEVPFPGLLPCRPKGGSVCSVVEMYPASPCPASLAQPSGRLTRSTWRHGDTESGFEVGLRTASSTIRPLREGRAPARPGAQRHGPARNVPAPPSARGVRTD